MAGLPFSKMQGVGNDFVVVEAAAWGAQDWPRQAVALCDRKFGVGADGLLVIDRAEAGPDADFTMRMFNPDGSPDVCGNGLRCVTRYAVERGLFAGPDLRVRTLAGARAARALGGGRVRVGMGQPLFTPPDIPINADGLERVTDFPLELPGEETLEVTALSTGSTHAVTFVDALPDDAQFFRVSPLVEHSARFPERTSLMWCVVEAAGRLRLRIWERGAGETWGCGTGACAAAVAAVLRGVAEAGEPVTVASKGGELVIRWQPGGEIEMTGPAEFVFEGVWPL